MERVGSRKDFIREMRRRGYDVRWEDGRKSITYTTPTGMKCRDDKLHEQKFRKEKMEDEFRIRQRAAEQRRFHAEAAGTDASDLDGAVAQRPLYDAHADGGAAGKCPAEHAGTTREYTLVNDGAGNERKPGGSGNSGNSGRMGRKLDTFRLWTPLTFIGSAMVSTVFTILMRILLR